MSRNKDAAEQAAQAANEAALASEAGRVLQQRAQESVKEEKEPEFKPTPKGNPRDAIEDELTAKYEAREKERIEKLQAAEKDAAPPVETPTPTEAVPEPQAAAASEPKTVRVKIYGEEKEVPESEVEEYGGVKGYQIAMAAKKDREELKAQLDQARETQKLMTQFLVTQKPKEPVQTPAQALTGLMDEIRFGTQEQAAAAFQKALQTVHKAPDEQQIILKATVNFQHDAAQKAFHREFADVLATPEVKQLAALLGTQQLSQYVVNGQPNWQALATVDFDNHYRMIGNRIRNMLGGKTQAAPVPQTGKTSPDKEAKKASIVNLPTASQRASLPAEEKPQTREEIIREERKARGLPV